MLKVSNNVPKKILQIAWKFQNKKMLGQMINMVWFMFYTINK